MYIICFGMNICGTCEFKGMNVQPFEIIYSRRKRKRRNRCPVWKRAPSFPFWPFPLSWQRSLRHPPPLHSQGPSPPCSRFFFLIFEWVYRQRISAGSRCIRLKCPWLCAAAQRSFTANSILSFELVLSLLCCPIFIDDAFRTGTRW